MGGQTISLRARALRLLSLREHSRAELSRKLAPHAESPQVLEQLLDELQARGWQSEDRFADSLARRRSSRHGVNRVALALREHRLDEALVARTLEEARSGELEVARNLWSRKFGGPPTDLADRARQYRFLASRGFTAATIRVLLGGTIDDE